MEAKELPQILAEKGAALLSKGAIEEALEMFTEAIRLAPEKPSLYSSRGMIFYGLKKYDEAIIDLLEAVKKGNTGIKPFFYLALAYNNKEMWDEAIDALDQSLKFNPDEMQTYFIRAKTFEAYGKYQNAIKDFQKYIDLVSVSGTSPYMSIDETIEHIKKIKSEHNI